MESWTTRRNRATRARIEASFIPRIGIVYASLIRCPGYVFGSDGSVFSYKTGRVLKWLFDTYGYPMVRISIRGIAKSEKVHSLILETFSGPRPTGYVTRHLDGNKQNNNFDNLAWGTQKENWADMRRHGTAPVGENAECAKLTWPIVRELRKRPWVLKEMQQMAASLGVCVDTLRHAHKHKTW